MKDATSKLIAGLILTALVWAFGYGVFAFMCWEANPGNWDISARGMMASICAIITVFVFGGVASV